MRTINRCILSTAEHGIIKRKESISDCMISNFARGFIELGHQVTLLASAEFMPTGKDEGLPFDVIYFPSQLPRVFKPSLLPWPRGMRQWLKQHAGGYDLVITSEAFQISSLIASRVCPSRLIIWQEMDRHQRLLFKLPSRLWHNTVVRLLMRDVTVVPRSEPAREFIGRYSRRVSDVTVDHGTDARVLHPGEEHDKAFIVVSQLVKRKNVDSIITKFARLVTREEYQDYRLDIIGDGDQASELERQVATLVAREEYKDYRLDIIGDGDQAGELQRQVSTLGIGNNVTFHGFLSHARLADRLRRALALLVDTSSDLNMVTIAEAITSGTPVVTNTKPSTARFIRENGLGIVRDGWDENDLIQIIAGYDRMHDACVAAGKELTNVACARKMIHVLDE